MKLIRYGNPDEERPGILLPDGRRIDASAVTKDYDEAFFSSDGLARLRDWADQRAADEVSIPSDVRWGAPIARPSKIVCVGLNYAEHARESGAALPAEPVLFFKSTTAMTGPYDDICIPWGSEKTDWEVELAVVIGSRTSRVSEEAATRHIAGYMLHNDVSERAFQLERGGQWVKGKSCDTFAPLGPWLATSDEISDPGQLRLWLKVNGDLKQNGSTSDMIFDVPFLISYISQFMTLLPGDIISTGTPSGVGLGLNPPQYLKTGDVVELGIDGLGESRQRAVASR